MRIVGLDLSLCATGWCELHVGVVPTPCLKFGTIKPLKVSQREVTGKLKLAPDPQMALAALEGRS
jgi:hypothetical protein